MATRILSHIVAASENNVIGINGEMPWHLPDDFRFFKNTTWALPVIMGRKTFEAMNGALPGRINIVMTSNKEWKAEEVRVAEDIPSAIRLAEDAESKEIFIIGGGSIFRETMGMIQRIYMTRVHTTLEGDTLYPAIQTPEWEKISERFHPKDQKHLFDFTFETWQRK